MSHLEKKVALVTGASRGIGKTIALNLATQGATVVINYSTSKALADEVVEEVRSLGSQAMSIQTDVSDYDQVKNMLQQTVNSFGSIDIFVNNAGMAKDNLIFNMTPDEWQRVMDINCGGVFNCTKASMEYFMAKRDGVIVNISSVMGERGWIGESNYAASKGAINAFTRCSTVELARLGVRVNAVMPGFCPTELVSGLMAKDGG